jgi:hypothetical protein
MKFFRMKYVIVGGIILLIVDAAIIVLAFLWY